MTSASSADLLDLCHPRRELYTDLERQKLAELSVKQARDRQQRWRVLGTDGADPGKRNPLLAGGLHSLLTVTVFGRKHIS